MQEVISKITSKNQTTIPKSVRNALNLNPKDSIKYIISNDGLVKLTKANSEDDMWIKAYQQEQKYGSIDTPEPDWGNDIESEDFG